MSNIGSMTKNPMTAIKIPPITSKRSRLSLSEIMKIPHIRIMSVDHISNLMLDLSEITQEKIQGE
jgi:hypothetical protein